MVEGGGVPSSRKSRGLLSCRGSEARLLTRHGRGGQRGEAAPCLCVSCGARRRGRAWRAAAPEDESGVRTEEGGARWRPRGES